MKQIKTFEQYNDSDLENLINDLDSIGQIKKIRAEITIGFPEFTRGTSLTSHPSWWQTNYSDFVVAEFMATENDYDTLLNEIKKGNFTQNFNQRTTEEIKKALEGKKIQAMALGCEKIGQLNEEVRKTVVHISAEQCEDRLLLQTNSMTDEEFTKFAEKIWAKTPVIIEKEIDKMIQIKINFQEIK